MIDIDALEALAKAATPGPWEASDYGSYDGTYECWYVDTSVKKADIYRSDCDIEPNHRDDVRGKRDMQFIAAANPATVIALIAEVRALREDKARLDFYEANLNSDVDRDGVYSVWMGRGWGDEFTGNTFRQAIDAARKEQS